MDDVLKEEGEVKDEESIESVEIAVGDSKDETEEIEASEEKVEDESENEKEKQSEEAVESVEVTDQDGKATIIT